MADVPPPEDGNKHIQVDLAEMSEPRRTMYDAGMTSLSSRDDERELDDLSSMLLVDKTPGEEDEEQIEPSVMGGNEAPEQDEAYDFEGAYGVLKKENEEENRDTPQEQEDSSSPPATKTQDFHLASHRKRFIVAAAITLVVILGAVIGITVSVGNKGDGEGEEPIPNIVFHPFPISVNIRLDDLPQETGWSLICDDGVNTNSLYTFEEALPGTYKEAKKEIAKTFIVEEGAQCIFTITDTHHDGLCCHNGEGYYRVYYGSRSVNPPPIDVIAKGGEFGTQQVTKFEATYPKTSEEQPGFAPLTPSPVATAAPTMTPAPTEKEPTYSPTSTARPTSTNFVRATIEKIALQRGKEFEHPSSYQSRALVWLLEKNRNIDDYSEKQLIQRYVLACIYINTYKIPNKYTFQVVDGQNFIPKWNREDNWMTNAHECAWLGVYCDADRNVAKIMLASNELSGKIPNEITLLSESLVHFDVRNNTLHNAFDGTNFLRDLQQLTHLDVSSSNFEHEGIPKAIGKLSNLEYLDIANSRFSGPINGSIFRRLWKLRTLSMGGNKYSSSIPDEISNLPNLGARLTGTIDFVQNMNKIFEMWLDGNRQLGGSIPTTLGDKTTLRSLSLTECSFRGSIPTELGRLTNMRQMWLYDNQLTGSLPSELGNMDFLRKFEVQGNSLKGRMPPPMCQLTTFGFLEKGLYADCRLLCDCCTGCF